MSSSACSCRQPAFCTLCFEKGVADTLTLKTAVRAGTAYADAFVYNSMDAPDEYLKLIDPIGGYHTLEEQGVQSVKIDFLSNNFWLLDIRLGSGMIPNKKFVARFEHQYDNVENLVAVSASSGTFEFEPNDDGTLPHRNVTVASASLDEDKKTITVVLQDFLNTDKIPQKVDNIWVKVPLQVYWKS